MSLTPVSNPKLKIMLNKLSGQDAMFLNVGLPHAGALGVMIYIYDQSGISRIHTRTVDLSRAPWEMYVIEGLDNIEGISKGSFAILTKLHHAAADGTAAAELTWALHDVAGAAGKLVMGVDNQRSAPRQRPKWTLLDAMSHMIFDNLTATTRVEEARRAPVKAATPKSGAKKAAKTQTELAS